MDPGAGGMLISGTRARRRAAYAACITITSRQTARWRWWTAGCSPPSPRTRTVRDRGAGIRP